MVQNGSNMRPNGPLALEVWNTSNMMSKRNRGGPGNGFGESRCDSGSKGQIQGRRDSIFRGILESMWLQNRIQSAPSWSKIIQKIALTCEVDFETQFSKKTVPKLSQNVSKQAAKMEPKWSQSRSKKRCTRKGRICQKCCTVDRKSCF